jgi:hypothetical protein
VKRFIAGIIAVASLAVACGEDAGSLGAVGSSAGRTPQTSPSGASPSPSVSSPRPSESPADPSTSPSPGGTPTPSGGQTFTYELWFATGNGLFVASRTEEFDPAVGAIALHGLLDGPTSAEKAAGVFTAVPSATELNGLNIEGGVATVDLSSEYAQGSGSAAELMRLSQVVYTLTQFPSVSGVRFEVDGDPVTVFGSHGITLDGAQTRQDFADLLPPVLVESPIIGARVGNPVTIAGTANVFEATVSIRIRDAEGDVIANTFTTATCGTGCRGDYSASVAYSVERDQQGTIEVFESSAKDGSPLFLVSIPVTFTT